MNKKNTPLFALGFIFITISVWQIYMTQIGLSVISMDAANPPVTIIMPSNVTSPSRPTVLIAHGLAASSEIMRGFALTLAHAGYTTVSWDFLGHGANPLSWDLSADPNALLLEADSALSVAESTG